jgi:hypothetical protein
MSSGPQPRLARTALQETLQKQATLHNVVKGFVL